MSVSKKNELPKSLPRWEIPDSWQWLSISEVGKIVTGNTPPTSNKANYGNNIPYVKPPELLGRGIWEASSGLSKKGMGIARVLPAGAVLVSCIGGLGKTGIAKVPVAFNQQINAIIFDENVLPEYGFYYAQTLVEWLYAVSSATTLPIVNKGKFQRASFPLAPLDQQKRIVAEIEKQFSRLDEAIANLKRVKANLKRYKAAVLKAAVEGKLTEEWRKQHPDVEPADKLLEQILAERREKWQGRRKYKEPVAPDTTDLPKLPEGWVWASADQLTSLITDGEHITPKRSSDGVLLLSARNVLNGKLALNKVDYVSEDEYERLSKRLIVKAGDVLLSCSGSVGRSCVVPSGMKFSLVRSVAVLRFLHFSPSFFCYQIQSVFIQTQIEEKKTQTAQANIFQGKIKTLAIAVPSFDEQNQIVKEVERFLSVVSKAENQIDTNLRRADRLRQSILKKSFSRDLI